MRYGVWRVHGLDQRTDDTMYMPLLSNGIDVLFHETDTRGKRQEKASILEPSDICTFDELLKCDIIDISGEDVPSVIAMLPKETKIVARVLATDTLGKYDEKVRSRIDAFSLNWQMPIPKDFPREKCHYIAGPIDINLFKPDPNFKKTNRPPGIFFVLYIGSILFMTKGFGDLINSVLAAVMKNDKIRLAIYGEDPAEAATYYNNVTNGIIRYGGFIPNRAQMVRVYLESDLFCQPLIIGQGSTGMLEALSCGLPLLARDCGENGYEKELIENGRNGYLCGGCDDLAEKMVYLSTHPNVVHEMGVYSRFKAQRDFSTQKSTKKLIELIEWLGFPSWRTKI